MIYVAICAAVGSLILWVIAWSRLCLVDHKMDQVSDNLAILTGRMIRMENNLDAQNAGDRLRDIHQHAELTRSLNELKEAQGITPPHRDYYGPSRTKQAIEELRTP